MVKKIAVTLLFILALIGCSKTGDEYLNDAKNSYSQKKYDEAVSLYEKACNKGNFKGCKTLADIYSKGSVINKDDKKADIFYKEAVKYADIECKADNKDACSLLAYLYEKGMGVDINLDMSDNFHIKACNLGAYGSCYYIARLKADNMSDFLMYMDKACQQNFADACLTAGNSYLTGFNESMALVDKDITKGLEYITKACQLNNQYCNNLADIFISGDDVEQNYTEAVKNYETALHYYESLCTTYDENNNACRNIEIIKSKYSIH